MPSAHIEREVKLGVGEGFSLPDLGQVVEAAEASPLPELALEATYYDTADLRLARWGVTVRHRSGEGDGWSGWTVKLPGNGPVESPAGEGLARREVVVAGGPEAVPPAVSGLVRAMTRDAPLVVVARLVTRRRRTCIRDPQGSLLLEVVDDEVSVVEGARPARFRELEVEVAGDSVRPKVLEAVVARLRGAGAGPVDPVPKVVRALGPRALEPPEPPPITLSDRPRAGEVVRAALVGGVTRLIGHDPGVRLGEDPEDVHQARVATRRLRSDLRTFRPLVDRDWAAELRGELKDLAAELGAVRDADVLAQRLSGDAAELDAAGTDAAGTDDAAAAAALLSRLAEQRQARREELLALLDGPRYVELLDDLVAAAQRPRLRAEADRPGADVLAEVVRRPWWDLERAVASLGSEPDDETLHQVRILTKRCRYAAEAVAPVFGSPARRLARALAGLQTVLGDLQDAVMAEAWLRQEALTATPAEALAAGRLVSVQRHRRAAARTAWRRAWEKASAKRLRAWIG